MNTIDIIHKKCLELTKVITNFCENNNITYYIIGGTFLGAIRHKGFIPWDDDVDIAMPREDYEKFIELFSKQNKEYKVLNYKLDKDYKYYISRICNYEYRIIENTGNISYLFVDIFPIDGFPKNKIIRKIHSLRVLYHRMKLSFYYSDTIDMRAKRSKFEKILIMIAKKNIFKKLINPNVEKQKIDKILKKYSFYESDYVGTIMGAYREREIVPKKYFGIPKEYLFEGINLKGPEKYDEYLTHMYGEYMKLPKEENRRIHCKEIKKIER